MEERQLYRERQYYRGVVLHAMRIFEDELNAMANSVVALSSTVDETNIIEERNATEQIVSSLIVNGNALRNLSEEDGIVILNIDNRTQLETLTLEEDVIVIRSINDHGQLQLRNGF